MPELSYIPFYFILSVFISWIWVDYYRLIDIFDRRKLWYLLAMFVLGMASTYPVGWLHQNWELANLVNLNTPYPWLNEFWIIFSTVGCIEETAKILPYVLFYFLWRKELKEPIDHLAFICSSALGFAAAENVLYFDSHGAAIILARAILSTVGHMINSALAAYGIIRYKYSKSKWGIWNIPFYFLMAILSHTIYDFLLSYDPLANIGWLMTQLYFLLTISLLAVILNNSLNNSAYFSYRKVIHSGKVSSRLLAYYMAVFFIQFVFLVIQEDLLDALRILAASLYFSGFVIMVTCIRLGRFKLIKKRWFPLKIEMPFGIVVYESFDGTGVRTSYAVKGDAYNEVYINTYYREYFRLSPLNYRNNWLEEPRLAYIEKKVFLKHDHAYYVIRIYEGNQESVFTKYLGRPKTVGESYTAAGHPILALMLLPPDANLRDKSLSVPDFEFLDWVVVKPLVAEETDGAVMV